MARANESSCVVMGQDVPGAAIWDQWPRAEIWWPQPHVPCSWNVTAPAGTLQSPDLVETSHWSGK